MALPIIYIMGQVKGRAKEKNKIIKDELQASEKANDFYKAMAEDEEDAITDRPSLIKRLRGTGLQNPTGNILPRNQAVLRRF